MGVANVLKGLVGSTIALSLLITMHQTVEGASARAAKDTGEQGKAIALATRHFQGQGFIDPMLSVVNVNDSVMSVEVDHKGWAQMDKGQKLAFLDRVNGSALSANGGVSIDIHISMNGSKVAASSFSAGQQFIRLIE